MKSRRLLLEFLSVPLALAFMFIIWGTSNNTLATLQFEERPERAANGETTEVPKLSWTLLARLNARSAKKPPELARLDGQIVQIPGYLIPLEDYQSQTTEFLLVPYMGACVHMPPPPPNQLVQVEMKDHKPVRFQMWNAYWAVGRLHVENVDSPFGRVAYRMEGFRERLDAQHVENRLQPEKAIHIHAAPLLRSLPSLLAQPAHCTMSRAA